MAADDYTSLSDPELVARDNAVAGGLADGTLSGNDLGQHLRRLANTAFLTGSRQAVSLLQRWAMSPPTASPLHRSWAVWSLLHTGFWGTVERVLLDLLRTPDAREVLWHLVAGTYIAPVGAEFMMLGMPEAELVECRKVLSSQRPWADPVQMLEPILSEYV